MSELFEQLLADPTNFVEGAYDQGYSLSAAQLEQVHLAGIRKRF